MAEDKVYKLKPTTPKALRLLSEHGLVTGDSKTVMSNQVKLMMDVGALQTLCEACFDEDFSGVDFDNIDLKPISRGLSDFLLNALGGSAR